MISTSGLSIDPRVYNESVTLIKAGHRVEVLCWDRENRSDGKEYYEIDGIFVKRFFTLAKFGTGFKQIPAFILFLREIKKYLASKTFDVIHGQDIDGVFIGSLIRKNRKLVWDMREFYDGFNHGKLKSLIYELIARWCFYRIDGLITVNEYQQERYRSKIKHNTMCVTILNTPEEVIFEGFCQKASDLLRISYIGSVRQYSELKLLMDAGLYLRDVKIQIHGSGSAYDRLIAIKDNYPNVEITGQFYYKHTKHLYEETDVLFVVYDKNIENQKYGIPIKGYEAIYTGTPVIVGSGTYFADFVEKNDIGFVISGDDKNELINVLSAIKNDRSLLLKKKENLKKIQHLFVWRYQEKKLSEFYLKLAL
jgi:glycosyltransferase involved in cell wall biosynthesis